MKFGNVDFTPVEKNLVLLGAPTKEAIQTLGLEDVFVTEIDPTVSDTAAYCEKYETSMDTCANCVIIEAKRADKVCYAAVLVPGDARADINGVVRHALDARKISFVSMDKA